MADIQNIQESWEGHSGVEVEAFVKQQLSSMYGYIRPSSSVDSNTFYHIECFNSAADALLYDTDPETYAALKLQDMTLPIATVSSDSYMASLSCNKLTSNNYVVKDGGAFEIGVRYTSVHIIGATSQSENFGANGTLIIERSVNNGTSWTQVATQVIRSSDLDVTTYPDTINVGQYLTASSANLIRLRVSFQYTDDSNNVVTKVSSNVIYSITSVNLSLESQINYNTPIDASLGVFPISYHVYGAITKTLHIQISGATSTLTTTYNLGTSQYITDSFSRDVTDANNTNGILSHGVHSVTAWLTCSDGNGGTLSSDVQVNRYMVINNATATVAQRTQPYIMLQNIITSVDNYAQTTLCGYSVFNPAYSNGAISAGTDPVDVSFLLTAYSENPLTDTSMRQYFRVNERVTPGQRNDLVTTVEIETEESAGAASSYSSYFRVWRATTLGGSSYVDFMNESMGVDNVEITVDNSNSFAPTAGSTFFLNPKIRNNTESDFRKIYNARNNNAEVPSVWTGFNGVNDGWVTNADDNQRVLRVLAGQRLNIQYNPFAQFVAASPGPESSMTLEFDFAVRNVTDPEDAEIIKCYETNAGGAMIGLRMNAMHGYLLTSSNGAIIAQNDFSWQEDVRTHISININHNVIAESGATPMHLVRVYINGVINREFAFSIERNDEFCTAALSNGGIYIGSDTADIDIYGIRCYTNKQLSSANIVNNWISTLPTSAEKLKKRNDNDVLDNNGVISAEKVKQHGKRVLIWHGVEPYQELQTKQKGYWEVWQYNADGTVNPNCSGTLCKASYLAYLGGNSDAVCLVASRQGSTANTYYYSNLQTKMKDVTYLIEVAVTDLHLSITLTDNNDGETCTLSGGNLSGNYDYTDSTKTAVLVPDGWIDTNGKYRGVGFQVDEGLPLGQKLVNKINYASCMQSHLQGGVTSYNDLHTSICGKNTMQNATANARVAKVTRPFFFFVQTSESSDPVYRGPCTFGPGKMDDVTWGYKKSSHADFIMIEGAENNSSLSDMRVPFDHKVLNHYDDGELDGWSYPVVAKVNLDMDKAKLVTQGGYKVPTETVMGYVKAAWNFLYWHNPRIKYYLGNVTQFLADGTVDNTYCYWMTEGNATAAKYELYRWEELTESSGQWVKAGMWDSYSSSYAARNLQTDTITASAITTENQNQYAVLNKAFIAAIVAHAKANIGSYFKESSLKFHYAYVNFFIAGTDNCSKNTYYVLDPSTHLFELHQDDLDTIFATDNNGRQTKPYYIDRMHPYADEDTNHTNILYEGSANVLFNLCELMYEDTEYSGQGELGTMMNTILQTMCTLTNANDEIEGISVAQRTTAWGFLHKYYFSVQYYFPAVAYNEMARIRYEYPASIGFVSTLRQIPPLTQSLGDQLQAELQYMKRRLVYAASYAAWGDFSVSSSEGSIGIDGSADSFALQAYPNPDGTAATYQFSVVPHQYLYPTGSVGTSATTNPHVRVAPGETYQLSLGSVSGDTGMAIYGVNYYRSFGNIGNISTKPDATFTLKGKRLISFAAEPSVYYTDSNTGDSVPAFRPSQIVVQAIRLQAFSLKGCIGIGGILNVSALTRMVSFDIRETAIYSTTIPQSNALTSIKLNDKIQSFEVDGCPNLTTLTFEGYDAITSLKIGANVGSLNTKVFATGLYEAKVTNATSSTQAINTLRIKNVSWTGLNVSVLSWIADITNVDINGTISIDEPSLTQNAVTFELKNKFNIKWGNVDDETSAEHQGLKITYAPRQISSVSVRGNFYNDGVNYYPFTAVPNSAYVNGFTKIRYSLSDEEGYLQFSTATIDPITGVLHVTSLSNVTDTAKVIITVTTYYEGTYGVLTAYKEISLYNRKAQLGDYVYHDGTYSSPDTYDAEKTVVGICCFVAPTDSSGDIVADLFNSNDKQKRLMVACKNATATGSQSSGGLTFSAWQWGSYRNSKGATTDLYDFTTDHNYLSVPEALLTDTSFYNIPTIVDITGHGLSTSYTDTADLRDEVSTLGIQNDGFRPVAPGYAAGDGVIGGTTLNGTYTETDAQREARTLTASLAALAGSGYQAGDMVNSGYAKTLKIIEHRNKILNNGIVMIPASSGVDADVLGPLDTPHAGSGQTELESLASLMGTLRSYMQSHFGDTNYAKWSQIYYPAASAAYAYEPQVSGVTLADKFKAHNWFLPAEGLLIRLCWWFRQGATSDNNIFKKAIADGVFTNFTSSNYWAATEYNTSSAWYVIFYNGSVGNSYKYSEYYVRAVAAF